MTQRIALLYTICFLLYRCSGLARAVAFLRWLGRGKERVAPKKVAALSHAELWQRLSQGYRWLPLPVQCLEQALIGWYYFNRYGRAAEMKIGLRLHPLYSHAWLECDGEVLGGIPGLELLEVMADYPPWQD